MYWQTLRQLLWEHRVFYIFYFLFFVAGTIVQFSAHQFNITLFVNGWNTPFLDLFFKYFTNVGDGLFAVAVVITIIVFKKKYTWESIASFVVPALVTQLLKNFVFADHYRPSVEMKDVAGLHYVPGVVMHELHSFPSGHSTSAFAIFTFLALVATNKNLGVLFLALAVLVGLSRIYLLQHFFEDVLVGSFIGVIFTTLIFALFEHYRANKK